MARGQYSEEIKERIVDLWNDERLSAGVLARMFGGTRSAIIGVVHRNPRSIPRPAARDRDNFKPRVSIQSITKKSIARKSPYKPLIPSEEPQPIGPQGDIPKGGCQFTRDHPGTGPWRMCGHPQMPIEGTQKHLPYCEYHVNFLRKPETKAA